MVNFSSDLKLSIASLRILDALSSLSMIRHSNPDYFLSILELCGMSQKIIAGFKNRLTMLSSDTGADSYTEVLKCILVQFLSKCLRNDVFSFSHRVIGFSVDFQRVDVSCCLQPLCQFLIYSNSNLETGYFALYKGFISCIWQLFVKLLDSPATSDSFSNFLYLSDPLLFQKQARAICQQDSFSDNISIDLIHSVLRSFVIFSYGKSPFITSAFISDLIRILGQVASEKVINLDQDFVSTTILCLEIVVSQYFELAISVVSDFANMLTSCEKNPAFEGYLLRISIIKKALNIHNNCTAFSSKPDHSDLESMVSDFFARFKLLSQISVNNLVYEIRSFTYKFSNLNHSRANDKYHLNFPIPTGFHEEFLKSSISLPSFVIEGLCEIIKLDMLLSQNGENDRTQRLTALLYSTLRERNNFQEDAKIKNELAPFAEFINK